MSGKDAEAVVRQIHDLLNRSNVSVSLAVDSKDFRKGGREEERFRDLQAGLISTGWSQLDAILPNSGLRSGMLMECLGALQGGGVAMFGLWLAWQMLSPEALTPVETLLAKRLEAKNDSASSINASSTNQEWKSLQESSSDKKGGILVVFDNDHKFYPPAAAALGISLDRLMILTPKSKKDLYWSLDQVLRCPAVGAVWSCMSKVSSREFRRLQLAAEAGSALGVLVREKKFERTPTWAHVRLQFTALPAQNRSSSTVRMVSGDWRFRVERKRAVTAMSGRISGASQCEIDLRDVVQTSGQGQQGQQGQQVQSEKSEGQPLAGTGR